MNKLLLEFNMYIIGMESGSYTLKGKTTSLSSWLILEF